MHFLLKFRNSVLLRQLICHLANSCSFLSFFPMCQFSVTDISIWRESSGLEDHFGIGERERTQIGIWCEFATSTVYTYIQRIAFCYHCLSIDIWNMRIIDFPRVMTVDVSCCCWKIIWLHIVEWSWEKKAQTRVKSKISTKCQTK